MGVHLKVTGHDNRGDSEYPFGFVYFTDDTRVAYTKAEGVVADATGGWPAVTARHVQLAERYLAEQGVLA